MKSIITLSLTLALLSPAAQAGDGHGHNHEAAVEAAPHGGVLRDAAPFKAELVLNGDQAKLYVYDKDLKPAALDKPSQTGHLKFPRQTKDKVVTFKKAATGDYYEAKLDGISKVHRYDLHIDLELGDKKVLADFGVDNIH